uniref:Uncharacterized protein n=1 Tax=Rhizophora mucronata TaxID=61149 RepID=A0A2P2IYS8_RHIMU
MMNFKCRHALSPWFFMLFLLMVSGPLDFVAQNYRQFYFSHTSAHLINAAIKASIPFSICITQAFFFFVIFAGIVK